MSTSTPSLARRERSALCDDALVLGADAPTLCDGWDARLLVAHLLVRERNPLAMPGIAVPPLARVTETMMERTARTDFAILVERLRRPSPPLALVPGLDRMVNTMEFYVHHEDLRRGSPDWTPRQLGSADQRTLWGILRVLGKGLARPAGVPVVIQWGSRLATLASGEDPVVVSGLPSELALLLHGRSAYSGLDFAGPPAAIAALRGADLGI